MGWGSSKERPTEDHGREQEFRAALLRARANRERFERLRATLQLRAALAQLNDEQSDSSTQSTQMFTTQITSESSVDGNDLAQLLALRATISQMSEESGTSLSRTEVSLSTGNEDSDSDDDDVETAINTLMQLGEIARVVALLKHGENAETILDSPSLGTRVGRKNTGEGNPNEVEAGTVVEVIFKLSFDVLWDKGERETFFVGCKDQTIVILDCAPAGVQHPQIRCDACPTTPNRIAGTRWKCLECYNFDLCTSCYMKNKHDTAHRFIRFDKENFNGCCVPPRSSSNEVIQSIGFFPGATVQRGPDWKWGEQDGGVGNLGKILKPEDFSSQHPRSGVKVQWSNGNSNTYRVGYDGKVDLKCVATGEGLPCHWNHLSTCGEEPSDPKPVFDVHQGVKCTLPVDLLKSLMEENGEWDDDVAEFIGKDGIAVGYMANNDVIVQYLPPTVDRASRARRCVWIFHPATLEKSAGAVAPHRTTTATRVHQTRETTGTSTARRAPPPVASTSGQSRAPAASGPLSMCQSCDEEYASVTFHPCGHNVVCEGCSVRMKKCMSCRANIETKTHVVIRKPAATQPQEDSNRECEICMEEEKVVAFVPCGHGACSECSQQIDQCHICRKQITSKIRTYF